MLAGVFMPRRGNRRASSRVGCIGDKYIEKTVGDIYSWEPVNENLVTGLCPTTYITQNGALLSWASDQVTWAGVKIDGGITQNRVVLLPNREAFNHVENKSLTFQPNTRRSNGQWVRLPPMLLISVNLL
jgi:hypothetical protein